MKSALILGVLLFEDRVEGERRGRGEGAGEWSNDFNTTSGSNLSKIVTKLQ